MLLLLDTHVVLWAAMQPERLSDEARELLEDRGNQLFFSAASVWEVAIKSARRGAGFDVDPYVLRRGLLGNGYVEIGILGAHTADVAGLPPIHRDPFDRLLVAQARHEGMTLVTADASVAAYGPPVRRV